MRQLLLVALCPALVAGCGEGFPQLPSSPRSDARVSPPPVIGSFGLPQEIQVGERVDVAVPKGGRDAYYFTLTAPADGTLTAQLAWDSLNDLLRIQIGETIFGMVSLPGSGIWDLTLYSTIDQRRSLVGSVSVGRGERYQLVVASVPGYWDYGLSIGSSFTLTTSLQ